jgi:hypothetical protein
VLFTEYFQVCQAIKNVDNALKQFDLPVYYSDPRPHISIGWTLGDIYSFAPSVSKKGDVSSLKLSQDFDDHSLDINTSPVCKSGKWVFKLNEYR